MLRGKVRFGKRLLLSLAGFWAVYLLIVVLVSIATPQHSIPMGQERCFDEMCFAVEHAETAFRLGLAGQTVRANGQFYVVAIKVTNRSRGHAQSEGGLHALFWEAGKSYEVSSSGQRAWEAVNGETSSLTTRLGPGESVTTVQVFDIPAGASTPGLVLTHGFTPGYFVIGESPIFREPTLMRIEPDGGGGL
jgi:hypothetical protein